jgi:hypothetical protein
MDMHNSQPSTGTIAPGETPEHDPVHKPKHYQGNGLEVITVIEGWGLGPHLANALKYCLRYRDKNGIQDLEKAKWYLNRAKLFHGPLRIHPGIGPCLDAVHQAFEPTHNIYGAITCISVSAGVVKVAQNAWLESAIEWIDREIEDLKVRSSWGEAAQAGIRTPFQPVSGGAG